MMTIAAVNVLLSGLGQVRGDAVFVAIGHLLDVASAFLAVWAISTDHRSRAGGNVDP
jgi:preprotein translocase subunit SecD